MRDEAEISNAGKGQSQNCYLNVEYPQIYYRLLINIQKIQFPFPLEASITEKPPHITTGTVVYVLLSQKQAYF